MVTLNVIDLNVIRLFEGTLKTKDDTLKYEWQSTTTSNPEFARVYIDNANHILYGVRVDGSIVAPTIPSDIKKGRLTWKVSI